MEEISLVVQSQQADCIEGTSRSKKCTVAAVLSVVAALCLVSLAVLSSRSAFEPASADVGLQEGRDALKALMLDADASKAGDENEYFADGDNFEEDPSNTGRGDWGKCMPVPLYGILGPSRAASALYSKLSKLHHLFCVHIDISFEQVWF